MAIRLPTVAAAWVWPFTVDGTEHLVAEFQTTEPAGVAVPAGTWTARLFTSNSGHDCDFLWRLYHVTGLGETLLHTETITPPYTTDAYGVAQTDFTFNPGAVTFAETDSLIIRVHAQDTGGGGSTDFAAGVLGGNGHVYSGVNEYVSYLLTPTITPGAGASPVRTFVSPAADPAPWTLIDDVDITGDFPEATDLLGYLIVDIEGLDSTSVRQTTQRSLSIEGGTVEVEDTAPRRVKITALMFAASSQGLEWGERWLTRQLVAPLCDSCRLDGYSFRECCPGDDPTTGYWAMFDAGLVDAITVTPLSTVDANDGDLTNQSCFMAKIEFTLGAEDPWLYKPWTLAVAARGWDPYTPAEPALGVDGVIVDFGDSSDVQLDIVDFRGNTVTLFSTTGVDGKAIWDGARHRLVFFNAGGEVVELTITLPDGQPLEWPDLDSACEVTLPTSFVPSGDGTGAAIYLQHRELL